MRNFIRGLVAMALFATLPALATPQYTATHRSATMTDLVTAIGSTGYLCIYSGTIPTNVATAATGTILVAMPMAATAGTVTTGVLTFGTITSTAATATGTATHFRIATSSACTTVIIQGTVGTSGSDLNFSGGVAFTSGTTITVSSFSLTANGL